MQRKLPIQRESDWRTAVLLAALLMGAAFSAIYLTRHFGPHINIASHTPAAGRAVSEFGWLQIHTMVSAPITVLAAGGLADVWVLSTAVALELCVALAIGLLLGRRDTVFFKNIAKALFMASLAALLSSAILSELIGVLIGLHAEAIGGLQIGHLTLLNSTNSILMDMGMRIGILGVLTFILVTWKSTPFQDDPKTAPIPAETA